MKQLTTIIISLIFFTNILNAQHVNHQNSTLENLVNFAQQSNSSSLIVIQDGEVIAEEYFGGEKRLIETMSVTKLIVSIGVGKLYTDGKIDSIDQAVSDFYPEWRQGKKREVTIRHLLDHTSGLQNEMNTREEIYPSPDVIQLALAAELTEDPGTQVRYNNKAVNLLAGIFEQASGMRMDEYFEREIFNHLEIDEYEWQKDSSGNPYAMAGLRLMGIDVVKFGQLILNNGVWEGEKLISPHYLSEMLGTNHDNEFGLLWKKLPAEISFTLPIERLELFKERGVSESIIDKLRAYAGATIESQLEGQQILIDVFGTPQVFHQEMVNKGFENVFIAEFEGIAGYYGDGDLGQYLIVLPEKEKVVVRQIEYSESYNIETDSFPEILEILKN